METCNEFHKSNARKKLFNKNVNKIQEFVVLFQHTKPTLYVTAYITINTTIKDFKCISKFIQNYLI